MTIEAVLRAGVLLCAAYLCLVYSAYFALMVVGYVENRRRRREFAVDDVETLAGSRFLPGVSVVVAGYNEGEALVDAVRSLLALDYPDFEVIVVNDGSTDDTLSRLLIGLDLVSVAVSSRGRFPTARIGGYYRTSSEPRLLVIDKENGGKADALNAGLDHARYAYVCGVDADMIFARDALTRAMRVVVSDPERIVGLTSFVEIAEDPSRALVDGVDYDIPDQRPLIAYQTLDYLRAFYNNRIAWSRLEFMLCAIGAFQIWRRDLLDELGGWARDYTCEDIELTFRVHQVLREQQRPYRVVCLPDRIGVTEGPDTVRKLVAQRERWQRVILETWWSYRRMCLNRRYGSVGLLGMPFYLLSEIVAPVFEVIAVATLLGGALAGLVDWKLFALVTLIITVLNSILSTAALAMVDQHQRVYRGRGIARLLLLMPLELFVYRPVMAWARVKGTWRFLRGDKGWHKFERNVRVGAA
ncbi:MAG TPA: glycosyltransferase family 2 protein [Gaiella sp.]|nr:glycosyltransferase family 2 protein [Gaiella sp.]